MTNDHKPFPLRVSLISACSESSKRNILSIDYGKTCYEARTDY